MCDEAELAYYTKAKSNLVCGGNVKDVGHVGALYALKNAGFEPGQLAGAAGTSANSITALAVALNLLDSDRQTAKSLFDILVIANFCKFCAGRLLLHPFPVSVSQVEFLLLQIVYSVQLQLSSRFGLTPASKIREIGRASCRERV